MIMRLLLTLIMAFGMCLTSFGAATWPASTNGNNTFFGNNTFKTPSMMYGVTVTNAGNTAYLYISGNQGIGGLTGVIESTPSGMVLSGDTGLGNSIQISPLGVLSGNGSGLTSLTIPDPLTLNQLNVGTLILTNTIAGTNITGATTITNGLWGANLTNGLAGLNAPVFTGIVNAIVDSPTNTWTPDTAFPLGTAVSYQTNAAVSFGFTSLSSVPTTTERYGQLTIYANGADVTFSNISAIHFSDGLTNRTVTNGSCVVIAVDVIPGLRSNAAICHFP